MFLERKWCSIVREVRRGLLSWKRRLIEVFISERNCLLIVENCCQKIAANSWHFSRALFDAISQKTLEKQKIKSFKFQSKTTGKKHISCVDLNKTFQMVATIGKTPTPPTPPPVVIQGDPLVANHQLNGWQSTQHCTKSIGIQWVIFGKFFFVFFPRDWCVPHPISNKKENHCACPHYNGRFWVDWLLFGGIKSFSPLFIKKKTSKGEVEYLWCCCCLQVCYKLHFPGISTNVVFEKI